MMNDKKAGFPPIADSEARILILGTMPGEQSLLENQYYAHPRNAFWKIMGQLLEIADNASYQEKTASLIQHRIALWDVIQTCSRDGSLDSSIQQQTITVNSFADFFCTYPTISKIFFNGARAEQEYRKRVLPTLPEQTRQLPSMRLPSTSPAMARLSWQQKYQIWSELIKPFM